MAQRAEQRAIEHASELLWAVSMDDYAAGVLTWREDGAAVVDVAAGESTWFALVAACGGDRAKAGRLAEARIAETWTRAEALGGSVGVRRIEDAAGAVVGWLFGR